MKKGFTLIELMVASSIFIIVMVIAVGAVLSVVDANRKAQSLSSAMTNLNFAVESMVREINTGHEYCQDGCSSGTAGRFSFRNGQNQAVVYSLDNQRLIKYNDYTRQTSILTAPEVQINSLNFSWLGDEANDHLQPTVLLFLQGTVGTSLKTKSTFKLQTLITQRRLDS